MRIRVCCAVVLALFLHGALEAAASQVQNLPDLSQWIGRTVTWKLRASPWRKRACSRCLKCAAARR